MNFLELCQRVRQESGISGSGPESVLNQKAILQKVVEWVRQADLDVKRLQEDWLFMWRMSNANFSTGIRKYDGQSLGLSNMQAIQSLDINGDVLQVYTWEQFKLNKYHLGTEQGKPDTYTIQPDGLIVLHPVPDKNYTAIAEYNLSVVAMTDDNDVSLIPTQYHDVILHKALMYYASHEEDNSLYQVSLARYETALSELSANYLPRISLGRGIA